MGRSAVLSFELVRSVNAGRRPDLRAAILERSFQRGIRSPANLHCVGS